MVERLDALGTPRSPEAFQISNFAEWHDACLTNYAVWDRRGSQKRTEMIQEVEVLVRPHTKLQLQQPSFADRSYFQLLLGRIRALINNGTFVENQRVSIAPLRHPSEFRVGYSVLLVTFLPAPGAKEE
jgi:hypothetical protein